MKTSVLPMDLQIFAEPGAGDPAGNQTDPPAQPAGGAGTTPQIDYDKIQQMLTGTLSAKEDTALKAYFKQQGLSQEEMSQAITTFKQQKAAAQPDVGALQTQLAQAQAAAQQEAVRNAATLQAIALGVDIKTVPYLLKMTDLSQIVGEDGKVNEETLKNAINKVLEDIPALKPQQTNAAGFMQVGAGTNQGQTQTAVDNELDTIFGVKKK